MKKVYYSFGTNKELSAMSYLHPEKLSKNIPDEVKESSFVKCAAFVKVLKNTYVLKCPVDVSFTVNIKEEVIHSDNMELTKSVVAINQFHAKSKIFQFKFPYLFFSETPLIMQQTHPYLHINSFTDIGNLVEGEFDISKWFRPLVSAHRAKIEDEININLKRGDVYCYIRFVSDDNIELVPFEINNKIEKYKHDCLNLKKHTSRFQSLETVYRVFSKHGMNKRILREIKKQLI
jgi:hypothetical protein